MFVDDRGLFREDNNSSGTQGKLDDYSVDNIVEIFFSETDQRAKIRRYTSVANYQTGTSAGTEAELTSLMPIWNARDELAELDSANIHQQRTYGTAVSSSGAGRHILTWKDSNTNGTVDSGETTNFVTGSFTTDYGLLNTSSVTEANNIIDYIRGKEISGYRSRTIDFDGDGVNEVWRLGDVVHSTPTVVAAPGSAYDLIHSDATYKAFADHYSDRREVLYTGANDGMLHAFNSGFYSGTTKTFNTTNTAGTATAHPLGSELWAYVPYNLLPHLKWLTEADYPHVYYMDGPPKIFDANIFTADADHPGGWGTILVAGMRFGGGNLSYDHDNDGGASTPDITTRSAYVVLDITNPENPPTLIAEITDTELGFTTSVPTLAVNRVAATGNDFSTTTSNKWYLVFGSGPTDLDTATSSQNAQIFTYDLNAAVSGTGTPLQKVDTGIAASFVGNAKSADWEIDYIDDVAYFGVVSGTESSPTGRLMRLLLDTITATPVVNTMINTSQPFVAAPTAARDDEFNRWVYAGTGRLYTSGDKGSTTQQSYYGVKDVATETIDGFGVSTYAYDVTYTTSDLQNVTGIQVFENSTILDPGSVLPTLADPIDTFSELSTLIKSKSGWYRNFAASGNPSRRNFTSSVLLFDFVLFTTFDPPLPDVCDIDGSSNLFAIYYKTGTAYPNAGLGNDSSVTNSGGDLTVDNISLGAGPASEPTPNPYSGTTDSSGNVQMGVNIQMGPGHTESTELTGAGITGGRSGWHEIFDF